MKNLLGIDKYDDLNQNEYFDPNDFFSKLMESSFDQYIDESKL